MPSLDRRHAAPGTIERKYPHIVELAVGRRGLDVGLDRRHALSQFATHQAATRPYRFEGGPNVLSLVFFGPGDGTRLHRTVWRLSLRT
jgi:hypothetical protein